MERDFDWLSTRSWFRRRPETRARGRPGSFVGSPSRPVRASPRNVFDIEVAQAVDDTEEIVMFPRLAEVLASVEVLPVVEPDGAWGEPKTAFGGGPEAPRPEDPRPEAACTEAACTEAACTEAASGAELSGPETADGKEAWASGSRTGEKVTISEAGPRAESAPDRGRLRTETPAPFSEPVDFEAWMERALDALLERDYAAASVAFRGAASLRPENGLVRTNLERLSELGFKA